MQEPLKPVDRLIFVGLLAWAAVTVIAGFKIIFSPQIKPVPSTFNLNIDKSTTNYTTNTTEQTCKLTLWSCK